MGHGVMDGYCMLGHDRVSALLKNPYRYFQYIFLIHVGQNLFLPWLRSDFHIVRPGYEQFLSSLDLLSVVLPVWW